ALSDIDDVLHGGEIEFRSIPDDRDKGAPLFITDKEKENVFKHRSSEPGAPGVIVEGCDRHSNPRAFADQVLVAANGIGRSPEAVVAAAGDGVNGGAREIALAHVERRDI